MSRVYLAGPIRGTTKEEMVGWRRYAAEKLQPLSTASPLRGFDHLMLDNGHMQPGHEEHPLRDPRNFTRRDLWDVDQCDAILFNFLGATKISQGSVIEIGYATKGGKLMAVVMDPENVHWYSMTRELATYVVPTLDQGIELIKHALLPYHS